MYSSGRLDDEQVDGEDVGKGVLYKRRMPLIVGDRKIRGKKGESSITVIPRIVTQLYQIQTPLRTSHLHLSEHVLIQIYPKTLLSYTVNSLLA